MYEEIETAYAPSHDITFILKYTYNLAREQKTTTCIGWYYGEPNEEDTKAFCGNLIAKLELYGGKTNV